MLEDVHVQSMHSDYGFAVQECAKLIHGDGEECTPVVGGD